MTPNSITKLSSLSEWSVQHIKGIFEAETDEDSLRSISTTFADDVSGYVNGSPLNRKGIERLVLTMRKDSSTGLKVDWKHLVEVPQDRSTNRDGSFGGYYIIRGLHKQLPGETDFVEYERHKTVTVQIASQSSENSGTDSRRIVYLVFVATDVRVGRGQA